MDILQENEQQFRRGKIHGYDLLGATYHCSHGLAIYVRTNIQNTSTNSNIHKLVSKQCNNSEHLKTISNSMAIACPEHQAAANNLCWQLQLAIILIGITFHWWQQQAIVQPGVQLISNVKKKGMFKSVAWNCKTNADSSFITEAQTRSQSPKQESNGYIPSQQTLPIFLEIWIQIPLICSTLKTHMEFSKSQLAPICLKSWYTINSTSQHSHIFMKAIIPLTKKRIPQGFRNPGWNEKTKGF